MIEGKAWYTSKTIWGGIIAGFSPLIGRLLGTEVTPEIADAISVFLAAAGGALAVIGRVRAEQPITKK